MQSGSHNVSQKLHHILGLSRAMLSLAHQRDWGAVDTKEQERRRQLETLFSKGPPTTISRSSLLKGMNAIQVLDQQIVLAAEVARTELANKISALNLSRYAQQEYRRNAN